KTYTFAVVSFVVIALQVFFIAVSHDTIKDVVRTLAYLGTIDLLSMIVLQIHSEFIKGIEHNMSSLFHKPSADQLWIDKPLRILMFNWRDTKHIYAGGAEVYIHELARRWVQDGNKVTI